MNPQLAEQIIEDKRNGIADESIGKKYGINLKQIEKAITRELGINISNPIKSKKAIVSLEPKVFEAETSTVWSFKSRGVWATHNGNYRGNWSPYIPRNVILKYSKEGDLVLDYFCGGGTTAVEAKLLNRNFIGIDINPHAIELAKSNISFETETFKSKIVLKVGDARSLTSIQTGSIDLICAHPPYADIVHYTHDNGGDLSNNEATQFLDEIEKVAKESYRVLKPNSYCAILIGDMRKNKNVIPLGFWTIERYLKAGFKIKELIIKRQHNCKTTGFWYSNSVKYNFLLLAHEFLVVFKKTANVKQKNIKRTVAKLSEGFKIDKKIYLEATSVWIFEKEKWLSKTVSNLFNRYMSKKPVVYNTTIKNIQTNLIVNVGCKEIGSCLEYAKKNLKNDGILAVICEDIRDNDGSIYSSAMELERKLRDNKELKIKELIVVSLENGKSIAKDALEITHRYILVYKYSNTL